MTLKPARKLGLLNRGKIDVGQEADILVFDPDSIADLSTYENPQQYPKGIGFVLVNGQCAVRDDQYTGLLPGRVLTKPI